MKFRALLNQPTAMRDLHSIISMLSKIHRDITLILEPNAVQFVLAENVVQGTPWLWADIASAVSFFAEYTMLGVDPVLHNRIVMSLNGVKLAAAVAALSKSQVRYVKWKLTNRQFPCLTVELEIPSAVGGASVPYRKVTHDVPVTLIAVRDWPEFEVPRSQLSGGGVEADEREADWGSSIAMPSVRSLRTLVDRIKNLSPSITVYYNEIGDLSLVIETDMATVASHYRNLQVRRGRRPAAAAAAEPEDAVAEAAANGEVSCRVSSKQMSMILGSLQMPVAQMWCHIERDELMNLRVQLRPMVTVNCMFNVVAL